MASIFSPNVPDQPKVDESKIRANVKKRRLKRGGYASTNIVNKPTLGGPTGGSGQ